MSTPPLAANDFDMPRVLLAGTVDYEMYKDFRRQLAEAPAQGLVIIELSTLGGDPEVARMMGEDIRFHSDLSPQRRFVFLGKAAIYSAGATFMSFFAICNRYLTRGTRVMIHERKLDKMLQVSGPLTTCGASVEALLNEIPALYCYSKRRLRELGARLPNKYGRSAQARSVQLVS